MYLSRCGRSAARLLPLGSSRATIVSARASIAPRLAPQSRGVASTRDSQHKVSTRDRLNGNWGMFSDSHLAARGLLGGLRPRSLQHPTEGASSLIYRASKPPRSATNPIF
jgi:hypothetical protein